MRTPVSIRTAVRGLAFLALSVGASAGPAEAGKGGGASARGRDTTAPTLTLPADITVGAIAPLGAQVVYSPTATDDKDPSPVVVCDPPSRSGFPVGTTTVTVTAKDWKGNTTTGTFDVTVTPMTAPVAFKEYWMDGDGRSWYEWDITVSPDGTVSGVGQQTNLIVVYHNDWGDFDYGYAVGTLPPEISGSGVLSGTISADGSCQFTSSRNYWYVRDWDADGNPILSEDTGGFSGSTTVSFVNGGLVFSVSPLDSIDYSNGYYELYWIPQ